MAYSKLIHLFTTLVNKSIVTTAPDSFWPGAI